MRSCKFLLTLYRLIQDHINWQKQSGSKQILWCKSMIIVVAEKKIVTGNTEKFIYLS